MQEGVNELHRVVCPGGRILIADNAGGDAFSGKFEKDLSSDAAYWVGKGFERTVVKSAYKFDNLEEAYRLFDFYWLYNGRPERTELELEIAFDIAVYEKDIH